jgi:hypothetical protein
VSLVACLGQLSLSLFLWSTAHRGPWDIWQHRSSTLRKAEPQAMGHRAVLELSKEARSGAAGHAATLEITLVRSEAAGHVAVPEPTSTGR